MYKKSNDKTVKSNWYINKKLKYKHIRLHRLQSLCTKFGAFDHWQNPFTRWTNLIIFHEYSISGGLNKKIQKSLLHSHRLIRCMHSIAYVISYLFLQTFAFLFHFISTFANKYVIPNTYQVNFDRFHDFHPAFEVLW